MFVARAILAKKEKAMFSFSQKSLTSFFHGSLQLLIRCMKNNIGSSIFQCSFFFKADFHFWDVTVEWGTLDGSFQIIQCFLVLVLFNE